MDFQQDHPRKVEVTRGNFFSTGRGKVANDNYSNVEQESLNRQGSSRWAAFILDGLLTFSLAALFFGIPLFFTGITFQGLAFEKQIYMYLWVLLALVAWTSKGVIFGEMKIRRTPLDIPIIAAFVAYVLSTAFSVDRWHSFWGFFGDPSRGLMGIMALIIAYYVIVSNFTKKRFAWMIGSLVVSSMLISIWSLLVVFNASFIPQNIAAKLPVSTIGSISGLTVFLGMIIPLLVISIFNIAENEKMGRLLRNSLLGLLAVFIGIDLFLLSALYSFAPWLAIISAVSIFLIYILAQIVRPKGNWSLAPMLVFIGVLVILMIGKDTITKVSFPIEVSPNYGLSWEIAKKSLGERLMVGSGPATYGYDFSKFKPQEFNSNMYYNLRFYQGTGVFFEFISTLGLVGSITFTLLTLTFISVCLYLLSREKERNKMYSLGLFTSVALFIIAAVTVRLEGTLLILGALLGALTMGAILWESNTENQYLNLSLKASAKFALALAFMFMVVSAGVVFLFVFIGKAFVADTYAGMGTKEKEVTENGSAQKFIQAINLFPYEGRYYTRLGQEYMVIANNEFLKDENSRDPEQIRRMITNSITAANEGKKRMDKDVLATEVVAQVYENAVFYAPESQKLAEESYQKSLELEPHNPAYFVKLGQLKTAGISQKSPEEQKKAVAEAKDLFQKSIDEKTNFAVAYYQRALTEEALGDVDKAIEDMGTAVQIESNNINYVFGLGQMYQKRGKDEDNKIAEEIYKKILESNKDEINTHLALGTLYEKTKRKNDAISEYQKVLDLLPANQSDDVKKRLRKMISNVQAGIENTPENIVDKVTQDAPPVQETPPVGEQEAPQVQQPSAAPQQTPQGAAAPQVAPQTTPQP